VETDLLGRLQYLRGEFHSTRIIVNLKTVLQTMLSRSCRSLRAYMGTGLNPKIKERWPRGPDVERRFNPRSQGRVLCRKRSEPRVSAQLKVQAPFRCVADAKGVRG
jgi:hypothetical protein